MYCKFDSNVHHTLLIKDITDHRKSEMAVPIDDKFVVSKNGRKSLRKTTKGWYFLCLWKYGSTMWAPLKDLKESNPVDISEYVVGNIISEEDAFALWVPYTLKKCDRIIFKVKACFLKKSHKFGVEIPTSVEEVYRLNQNNNNALWRDAIKKEITNVYVAFHILYHSEEDPLGCKISIVTLYLMSRWTFAAKPIFLLEATQQTCPRNPLMLEFFHRKVFVLILL